MSDVFISYAHSTEVTATRIAEALRAAGYGVWRDDELPAHRAFAEVIEERLRAAKAVVVIWSDEAVRSEWVQSEADRARQDRKLVQLSIDGSRLPMPFDRIQCADLTGWSGDVAAPGWRKVAGSIDALVRGVPAPISSPFRAAPAPASAAQRRLAVLAFDNLSPDPEMGFFSDGVSEEILETVSRNTDLAVIARASSFQFRGPAKAARNVASELNVSHLLDGSVRRSGQKVRVSAQLVECATEAHIWSERFDRDLDDVFALQDEIAAAVAAALKIAFERAGPAPGKVDPAAYDLFLRARDQSEYRPVRARMELLEQCVARAPDFALGHAWLAFHRVSVALNDPGDLPVAQLVEAAHSELATAERLDPTLSVTRIASSWLEPFAAYQRREALLSEGLHLNPDDPTCLTQMSFVAGYVGRGREALALAEAAKTRDPQSSVAVGRWLVLMYERYDEQAAQYDLMRARWPGNPEFSVIAANFAAAQGDWARYDALVRFAGEQPFARDPRMGRVMRETFRFYDAIRDDDQAWMDGYVERLLAQVERSGTAPLDDLWGACTLGRADQAFQAIDRAGFDRAFRVGGAPLASFDLGTNLRRPFNGAMMDDARFPRLCAKIGLVAYWLDTDRWPDCADALPYDFRAEARKAAAEGLARRV